MIAQGGVTLKAIYSFSRLMSQDVDPAPCFPSLACYGLVEASLDAHVL